jgi:hypothetical protein
VSEAYASMPPNDRSKCVEGKPSDPDKSVTLEQRSSLKSLLLLSCFARAEGLRELNRRSDPLNGKWSNASWPISALGQKRTLDWRSLMFALPPKADIAGRQFDVLFWEKQA